MITRRGAHFAHDHPSICAIVRLQFNEARSTDTYSTGSCNGHFALHRRLDPFHERKSYQEQ